MRDEHDDDDDDDMMMTMCDDVPGDSWASYLPMPDRSAGSGCTMGRRAIRSRLQQISIISPYHDLCQPRTYSEKGCRAAQEAQRTFPFDASRLFPTNPRRH